MKNYFLIKYLGRIDFVPAPEQGEPGGLPCRQVVLESSEEDPSEHDVIVATLWDIDAFLPLGICDKVFVKLQFRVSYIGSQSRMTADIIDVKKVEDYE